MNEDDWLHLFRTSVPSLYRSVSRRVGGRRELAEDLVQETCLRAVRTWSRDGRPADPAAWMRTVASNLIRNEFRRRSEESNVALDGPTDEFAEEAGEAAAERERSDAIQRGLARLRPEVAALLCERHLDGDSLATLAERYSLSVRSVEGRLRRARQSLARHLDVRLIDDWTDSPGRTSPS